MTKPFITPCKRVLAGILALLTMLTLVACNEVVQEPPPVVTDAPVVTTTEPTVTTTEPTTTEPIVTEPPLPEPLEKYLSYYEENNDFIGWVSIPSLKKSNGDLWIDYAVLQAEDNKKYLATDFWGKKDDAGWIYADYKVPITETSHADNITLYGHSMKDGSFFRHVLDYQNKGVDFVKEHYVINFDTRWEENQYVVVACFLIGIYEHQDDLPLFEYFKCRNFETEEDYNYFYENIMLRNYYNNDIECEYGDEFLTLSTCAYTFSDSRFVVVARKVREGEDISGYADTYTKNRNKHMPSITKD